jgi:hypothetical protein
VTIAGLQIMSAEYFGERPAEMISEVPFELLLLNLKMTFLREVDMAQTTNTNKHSKIV